MEIKEILEILRRCTYGDEVYLIKEHGATLLLDYITNLQQENERIKKMNMYEHKYGSDMEEKYLIEKTKNDRAVEYIKEHEYDIRNNFDCYVKGSELLDILNGRSDE